MSSRACYRIGELARLGGVSSRTIDYYTQLGLLTPLERSEGNYRLYGPDAVRRLRTIKVLQAQRLSLGEIAERLERAQPSPHGDVVLRVRQIDEQLARLEAELAELAPRVGQHLGGEAREAIARTAGGALTRTLALAQYLTHLLGGRWNGGADG